MAADPITTNALRFDFEAKRNRTRIIKNPQPVSVPTKKKKRKTRAVRITFKFKGRIPGIHQAQISANTAIKLNRMCEINKEALLGSGRGYFAMA